MPKRYAELWYSVAAIALTTAVYALAYRQAGTFPAAYSFIGHGIGVLGFVLMLMAETLYSIRKQMTHARWGRVDGWLRFHIVTGIVGPYMVLLHTSMRFRGLAGVLTLLTAVVVASGFVGRYLYTALPRFTKDAASDPGRLARQRRWLALWHSLHVPVTWVLFALALIHCVGALYFATFLR